MVRTMTQGEAPARSNPRLTNWALPAKTNNEKPCAASGDTPAERAKAPKISPKGITPSRIGSWSRTPARNSRAGMEGDEAVLVSAKAARPAGRLVYQRTGRELPPTPIRHDSVDPEGGQE